MREKGSQKEGIARRSVESRENKEAQENTFRPWLDLWMVRDLLEWIPAEVFILSFATPFSAQTRFWARFAEQQILRVMYPLLFPVRLSVFPPSNILHSSSKSSKMTFLQIKTEMIQFPAPLEEMRASLFLFPLTPPLLCCPPANSRCWSFPG